MSCRVLPELVESVFMWLGHCLELAELAHTLVEFYDFQVPDEPRQLSDLQSYHLVL